MNVCSPLVPPAVLTVTVRGPSAAAGSIAKLAVSDLLLPIAVAVSAARRLTVAVCDVPPLTVTPVTVTPLPLTVTVVPPARSRTGQPDRTVAPLVP